MRQRPEGSSRRPKAATVEDVGDSSASNESHQTDPRLKSPRRSNFVWLILFGILIYSSWEVYHYQFESMPIPLTAEQAGKRGFSEIEARKHVSALTDFGPHPLGSDALDLAFQYVLAETQKIKKTAHWEVDVQVDVFHANAGANRLVGGLFKGKSLVYSDLSHIVVRILPKYAAEAEDSAILVSSHIDTVFSTEGAGDCSSCIAAMLELARATSQWAHGFKNAVIFLFNTGEEEGLNGAHSFITQHPWNSTIRIAIDLEAMGIGGKSSIFQTGSNSWAVENFALVAKYPSGHVIAQDLFASGAIKSATDFQVYREIGNLSGLDFAFTDHSAVYHTKNDKLELLKSGSLQHLGENILAFLLQAAASSELSTMSLNAQENAKPSTSVYFDILGMYMVTYQQNFANMLYNSVIMQSVLIWGTSLLMGGYPAGASLALSCLSIPLMWIFSLSFSVIAAFVLSLISPLPVPYVANPWLVVGLFAAPALLGALTGQHFGFLILQIYLSNIYSKKKQLSTVIKDYLIKLEAERWLYKAGFIQWLLILMIGNYYKIGSSYLALVWLVPPAFAYGLLEATLTPARMPKPLKLATLLIGLAAPILVSAGVFVRFAGTIIGMAVRFDRDPGNTPEWMLNVIISVYIAFVVCLTMVYLLSYVHLSGSKSSIALATSFLFGLSLAAVYSGLVPPFTEDTARAVNVVHVVDASGIGHGQHPRSFVSLFSNTPGHLSEEVELINEGFTCGRNEVVDFVAFTVKYGCLTHEDTDMGWSELDVPTMVGSSDSQDMIKKRISRVSIDTKSATRWILAVNMEEVRDFKLEGDSRELIPLDKKSSVNGWHIVQFSGGKNSPRMFNLTLIWAENSARDSQKKRQSNQRPLLKLRTDVDSITPKVSQILMKLPSWCSLFGKSTSPYTLAFLNNLPIDF